MGFYPKKINSIEELKLEKQKLLNESRNKDIKKLLSFDELIPKKERKDEGKEKVPSTLIDGLLKGGAIEDALIDLSLPVLQKAGIKIGDIGKDIGKKAVMSLGKEVLGGYLKWKAAELSFKGIAYLIKSRKKKRKEKKS